MIIGPMIRKMKEKEAAKNAPMVSKEETDGEAPGLRVGKGAWKWPPIWPYQADMFQRKSEVKQKQRETAMMDMMGMGGQPGLPDASDEEASSVVEKLDLKEYWKGKAGVTTDIDAAAAEKLKSHYAFYLRDGMSVLEFGAAEKSYLPDDLKFSRHVGVGLSTEQMGENPAITERLEADLNKVVEERGVDSDELRELGTNTFDVVLMANTIDFLENPREVLRTGWNMLKPGGIMMVAFTSRDAYEDKFGKAQTKMWSDFNDDQHMWVVGSCFQFSAGDGWENLKGFDISPEGVQMDKGTNPMMKIFNKSNGMGMFVVQARKGEVDESIDKNNPEKSFRSKMWMLPTLEERDKTLIAPRLARSYKVAKTAEEKDTIAEHIETLPKIYESLVKMDQFTFTFGMQAQLATDLARDPDFVANEEQILSMKEALGLRTPSADFWMPVGTLTANMDPEDKVNLLAHIVPRFGSGDELQEAALKNFVSALEPTFATIRSTCPSMSDGDIQLLGTELLAGEILQPGRSTREEFAAWLGEMNESELKASLSRRKRYKEDSVAEMKEMQDKRAAEEKRIEEKRAKMIEQAKLASEQRTIAFNPQTGKFEEVKK